MQGWRSAVRSYKLYSSLPIGDSKKWAEINSSAIAKNREKLLSKIRESSPDVCDICVVKADAYGHGVAHCVPPLARAGCRFFAVSCIEEALALRELLDRERCEAEILILGYTAPEDAEALSKKNLTQCVFSCEYAAALDMAAKKKIKVHIKFDTGMNRIGIPAGPSASLTAAADDAERVFALSHLSVVGAFTHFSRADEISPEADEFTRGQFERFKTVVGMLRERGCDPNFLHACNSSAAVRFPEFALDGVRLGLALYGCGAPELLLEPVMSLYSQITHIHTLNPGETLGYGGTFRSETPRLIATLPIGYADGFLRAYSGAHVAVITESGEISAPVVGRICMDQCMIDISGSDARVGDKVRIFGKTQESLEALARLAGTINYESLCILSARVPRILV